MISKKVLERASVIPFVTGKTCSVMNKLQAVLRNVICKPNINSTCLELKEMAEVQGARSGILLI